MTCCPVESRGEKENGYFYRTQPHTVFGLQGPSSVYKLCSIHICLVFYVRSDAHLRAGLAEVLLEQEAIFFCTGRFHERRSLRNIFLVCSCDQFRPFWLSFSLSLV